MTKHKFQLGDKVRQSAKWEASGLAPKTFTGRIHALRDNTSYPYLVTIGTAELWMFAEAELEAA